MVGWGWGCKVVLLHARQVMLVVLLLLLLLQRRCWCTAACEVLLQ